ncbi:MAG: hypothetical protein COX34_00075 [Candidatus Nealsonbacteria bacterium CG23_combo_of_CG06-09_8_20_14_all_36_12]|uniref:POTRA domain-containing protein n=1 Tax=Candidatus Nealsonbacteria bacterium CG23_combo_of_CG06-09_8_20_14_all_36_12 TaxID=1974718 RepID=A0A2G9Z135_9BACT|nr:MAG: hypothetical protein COX34_00075 [Candidatus Nealsonbacteria bacterium CG23_combo_of_CG06-09_8_20_14_all_36_12]
MKTYRKYQIKRKKSILKNRFFWLTLLFLVFVGGIFYLVYFAEFFQIKEIEISGTQKVSNEELKIIASGEIEKKLFLFSSRSTFLVNTSKIENLILEKFPEINKVNLKRKLPDKLFLEIEERQPWATLTLDEKDFYYCDENGIIFEKIEEITPPLLKIKNLILKEEIILGERVIEKDLIEKIEKINTKLRENLKIDVEEFIIPSPERLNVKTVEDWEIYFDPKGNLNWQIIELSLVLEKEIPSEKRENLEYIDLRFSKVYYKYR